MPIHLSRRSFLSRCAAVATATGLPRWFVEQELSAAQAPALPRGPNERPRIALIGCGSQGRGDPKSAIRFGDLAVVCDVDETHTAAAAQQFGAAAKAPD